MIYIFSALFSPVSGISTLSGWIGVLLDLCGPNHVSVSTYKAASLLMSVLEVTYVLFFILGHRLEHRRTGQTQSYENALQCCILWVHKLLYQKEHV